MNRVIYFLIASMVFLAQAQAQSKCGAEIMTRRYMAKDPANTAKKAAYRQQRLDEMQAYRQSIEGAKQKTTATYTIPVVFHIILSQSQINELGGEAEIERRVQTQIEVMNEDFNAQNADISAIPAGFKSVMGDAGFRFELAKRKPDGSSFKGYQLKKTTLPGFDYDGSMASKEGWCDAKFDATGGLDQWDPKKYMNVWIASLWEFGSPSLTAGITFNIESLSEGFKEEELGIVLQYTCFGRRSNSSQTFYPGLDKGRTMVHEAGHYFELYHIWGDFPGCSDDDGFSDTPLQGNSSSGCPSYPETDMCSSSGDGIMFMNHMDYADDACNLMFTKDQVAMMHSQVQPGKYLYDLTQHSELTQWPATVENHTNRELIISPNPSNGVVHASFAGNHTATRVTVNDVMGKKQQEAEIAAGTLQHTFDLTVLPKGVYYLNCYSSEGMITKKIFLQ